MDEENQNTFLHSEQDDADVWNVANEELLHTIAHEIQCKRWIHGRTTEKYQRRKLSTQGIALVLTLVSGILLLIREYMSVMFQIAGSINIAVSCLGFILGIIDAVHMIESHQNAFFAWHALHFYVGCQLTLPVQHRQPPSVLLAIISQQYKAIEEQSPGIPTHIMLEFSRKCIQPLYPSTSTSAAAIVSPLTPPLPTQAPGPSLPHTLHPSQTDNPPGNTIFVDDHIMHMPGDGRTCVLSSCVLTSPNHFKQAARDIATHVPFSIRKAVFYTNSQKKPALSPLSLSVINPPSIQTSAQLLPGRVVESEDTFFTPQQCSSV